MAAIWILPEHGKTGPVVVSEGTGELTYSFKAISEAGIESDIKTVVVKRDLNLPDGDIKIGTDSIKKILNTITFGLFFKDIQSITITASDGESGIAKIEYHLANEQIDDVLSITDWKDYENAININAVSRYVDYARITDNAGNSVITLGIQSATGVAPTEFTIVEKFPETIPGETNPPETRDNNDILMLMALQFVIGSLITIIIKNKSEKSSEHK